MKKSYHQCGYDTYIHDLQHVLQHLKAVKDIGCVYIWGPSDYFQLKAKQKIKEVLESENIKDVSSYSFKSLDEASFSHLSSQRDIFSSHSSCFILDVDQDKKLEKLLKNNSNSIEKSLFFFFVNSVVPNLSLYKIKQEKDIFQIRCFPVQKFEVQKFLFHLLKKNSITISAESSSLLLEKLGDDPFKLENEIQKIALFFCEDLSNISYAALDSYLDFHVSPNHAYIHDLILKKNFNALYEIFQKWTKEGSSPLVFLGTITKFCRNVLLVYELKKTGLNPREISSKIGVPNFLVNSYTQHTNQKYISIMKRILVLCQDIDFKLKCSGVDQTLLLYHLIFRLEEMHV